MSAPTMPDPQTINGVALLEELHRLLTRYVVFPTPQAADAVTLYVAATHAQPAWEHATRLVLKSPLKRCGKSRLEEVIAETCYRPLRTANCSTAALVRSIGNDDPPTILLDEADTIFGGRKSAKDGVAEDLRGFINAGHSRGAPYLRWDMTARQLEECPTFGMAVLAGIGDLPDTIEDRAVVVSMRRRGNGEKVAPFRRRCIPALHALRDDLHDWVRGHVDILGAAEPAMPVEDRAADVWEPLVVVAALAGGAWPDRAHRACLVLTRESDSDADSASERLLADLFEVWGDEYRGKDAEHLFTETILERLHRLDEAPWADWYGKPLSGRGLANMLKPYGVKSRTVREGSGRAAPTARGYARADLTDPWDRYVPDLSGVSDTPDTPPHARETPPPTSADARVGRVADDLFGSDTCSDLGKDGRCDGVSDVSDDPRKPDHCRHGMPNGDRPDPWLNGRLSCPECAMEAAS